MSNEIVVNNDALSEVKRLMKTKDVKSRFNMALGEKAPQFLICFNSTLHINGKHSPPGKKQFQNRFLCHGIKVDAPLAGSCLFVQIFTISTRVLFCMFGYFCFTHIQFFYKSTF